MKGEGREEHDEKGRERGSDEKERGREESDEKGMEGRGVMEGRGRGMGVRQREGGKAVMWGGERRERSSFVGARCSWWGVVVSRVHLLFIGRGSPCPGALVIRP